MNEREIFINALKRDAADREEYLAEACGGDLALRKQVDALLAEHAQLGSFLESPAPAFAKTVDEPRGALEPAALGPGARIGPYKLLEQIGEGGMGVVYMAAQTHPVERKVALKLIKPGHDTRQVISRFDAERHALALMDHPNIAKVFDAGATESGQPYFVMELVHGVPITEYCDSHRLTPRERLELFIPVCRAVQHAHQKGIIHRDLKPSNVMVAQYDGKPVPKVIDFGVAKATGPKLTDRTLYTGFGTVVGTLEYMSPEQAVQNQLDVDTRSDIYSLGVLLYELLTGTTPLDHKRAKEAALLELLRIIKEEEPPKPSTRLSSTDELPSIAANRGLDPKKLSVLVRGDLDWIVMKALDKDRTRRYETANGLARDLDRYLHDEPVDACPPSAIYRLRKFARRNRVTMAASGFVAAALVLGTVISTWQAVRATHAEHRADDQRHEAEDNLKRAREAVDEYFTRVSQSKLFDVPSLQPLRRELLEAAVRYYQTLLSERDNNPALLADLAVAQLRVANIYHEVDRDTDAIDALASGLELVDRLRHEYPDANQEHCRVAGYWKGLRTSRTHTEMPKDPAKAERTLMKYVDLWEILAREHPAVVAFQNDLAAAHCTLAIWQAPVAWQASAAGRSDSGALAKAAVDSFSKAIAIWERLSQSHPDVPEYRENLVMVLTESEFGLRVAGRQKEGSAVLDRALELTEKLVSQSPKVPQYRGYLASSLNGRGHRLETAGRTREAAEDYHRLFEL
jgi:eukaryotic-like serine/threonine-protein kinase